MSSNLEIPFFEDVNVGQALPPLTKPPITHVQLVRYAGASGDFNPLHTDPEVGKAAGIGGIIAHGMLIMGFVGHMVSDYLCGPGALREFRVRFKRMTRIGDRITCSGTITRKWEENGQGFIEAEVFAADQSLDVKVLGTFTAALPSRQG